MPGWSNENISVSVADLIAAVSRTREVPATPLVARQATDVSESHTDASLLDAPNRPAVL
jgi:hypothetical protein